ncbi:MAG: peptide deformylase [Planctomycetota bacterium]|nr:peptide deformylase [Planctomycetota bacterium]
MEIDPGTLDILTHPHPALRLRAQPIEQVDDSVRAVASRMLELMYEADGIGLAAPQVGLAWRLFVTREPDNEDQGLVWVNPELEIIDESKEVDEEGCLSLPGVLVNVSRPLGVRIRGLNEHGKVIEAESDERIARVWLHERDHLDGVLIIDRMSSMERLRNRRAIRDLERG